MVIINMSELAAQFKGLVNDGYIHFFVFMVCGDIATGLIKGLLNKQGDSTKGLLGGVKHLLVVVMVLTAVPYLKLLGFEQFATTFVMFFIAFYGVSLTENWGQLGLPLPSFVKEALIKLKNETDKGKLPNKEDK